MHAEYKTTVTQASVSKKVGFYNPQDSRGFGDFGISYMFTYPFRTFGEANKKSCNSEEDKFIKNNA